MFYLIGLGLADHKDITLKGLEIIRRCSRVYLEAYTSILCYGPCKDELEEFYGKEITIADRDFVEQNSDEMLIAAKDSDVCLLVVGDPFGATTHSDLVLRCRNLGVSVKSVHNASIMNAIGCCGLQLYRFGETISIVIWTDEWQPDSYYDKIAENRKRGLHTLCLLDIKVKEQSIENMIKGRKIYDPPRYMSSAEAAHQLLQIVDRRSAGESAAFDHSTVCVGLARIGWDDQNIVSCTIDKMQNVDLGPPLHSLIICGQLHEIEQEMLNCFNLPT